MWADYYEKQGVTYAFFSAFNAAAAQEQAEKMWRREHDMDEDDEGEDDEDLANEEEAAEFASGDEVEAEELLSKKVEKTTLDADYEEGWSTEGEDEEEDEETAMDKRVANGDKIPMKDVVAEVNERAIKEGQDVVEDKRTRVLSVTELEDLFVGTAPDLSGESNIGDEWVEADNGLRLRYRTSTGAREASDRTRRIPQRREIIDYQRPPRGQEGVRLSYTR